MSNTNLNTVKAIGSAEVKTEKAAAAIVASVPEGYDWKARGAVPQAIIAWCGGEDEPQKTGPKGNQKPTNFGRGVDRLRKAVSALVKEDGPKEVTLRATLSGEGGGSVKIPLDSDLAQQILAYMAAQSESAAA